MSGGEREEGAARVDNALVVNTDPDWCYTEDFTQVPFKIAAKFLDDEHPVATVMYRDQPASNTGTRISYVMGNEEGVNGGVFSGVNRGYCRPKSSSSTVVLEGQHAWRHGDQAEMNCAGPEGPANTIGHVIFVLEGAHGVYWWDNPATGAREMVTVGRDQSVLADDGEPLFPESWQSPQWGLELPTDPGDYEAMERNAAAMAAIAEFLSHPYVAGPLQIVGGLGEIALAAPMVTVGLAEPVTTAAGVVIILHGSDSIAAGINTIATGEVQPTVTEQVISIGLMEAGVAPDQAVFYAALADGGLGLVLGGQGVVKVAGQADDILRNTYRMSDDFISSFVQTGQRIDAAVPEEALDEIGEAAADVAQAADGGDGVRVSQGAPERVIPLLDAGVQLPEGHYVHWAPIEALDGILGDQLINNAGRPHKALVWWGTDHTIPIVQGGDGVYVTRNTNPSTGFSILHGPSPALRDTSVRVGIVLDGANLDVRYHVPGAWVIKTGEQGGVHTDAISGLIFIPND